MNMMKKAMLVSVMLISSAVLLEYLPISLRTASNQPTQSDSVSSPASAPLYRSSVVGTDFDFITESDPNAFQRLEYVGFEEFEMPDKRKTGETIIQSAMVFRAYFNDGTKIGIGL